MKPLVTWLKVKRAAVTELTLIEKVQNKVKLKKKKKNSRKNHDCQLHRSSSFTKSLFLLFRHLITCLSP